MSQMPGYSPSPNPYDPSSTVWGPPAYQPPRHRGSCLWIALGLVGLLVAAPLCCLGCGGMLLHFGFDAVEKEIADDLNTDPIIQQHLGRVESAELHLWDSFEEDMENPSDDDDSWYVFDVVGAKGKGRVIGKSITNAEDLEELREGRLILPDGREFPLSK